MRVSRQMDATSPLIADTLSCIAAVDRAISFNEAAIPSNALRGSTIQSNTSIAMVKARRSTSAVPSPTHNSLQCITASLYTSILPMRFCARSTDNDWLALHASNSNLKKRPSSAHRRIPRSRRYNRLFGYGYRFPFRRSGVIMEPDGSRTLRQLRKTGAHKAV